MPKLGKKFTAKVVDLKKFSNPFLKRGVNKQAPTRQAQLKFLIYASEKDHSKELKNKYHAAMGKDMPSKSEFIDFLAYIQKVIREGEKTRGYATYSEFLKDNDLERAMTEGSSFRSVAELNPERRRWWEFCPGRTCSGSS
jgi:hypothetical protein